VPTLMRDMKDPSKAGRVIDVSYGLAMAIYLVVGVCGYIMYGHNVSDEVSGPRLVGTQG
jgi:vesicular inhibitory amino acid transporter